MAGTTAAVSYSASGDLADVNHVHFQLDSLPEVMDMTFDRSYQFTNVAAGPHVLRGYLVRVDHSKILGTDTSVNFSTTVPDTTPPTVAVTSPTGRGPLAGTVGLVASASDDVGATGVQFLLDGANLGAEVGGAGPTLHC